MTLSALRTQALMHRHAHLMSAHVAIPDASAILEIAPRQELLNSRRSATLTPVC